MNTPIQKPSTPPNLTELALRAKSDPLRSAILGEQPKPGKDENPWLRETYNLTRQAEITKEDSARAATLRAAAHTPRDGK